MVTKYNTMIRDGQKNTSAKVRKIQLSRCNIQLCHHRIHPPPAKYIHPAASDRNYIPGCLDLQWRTTSDAQVYLLVQ